MSTSFMTDDQLLKAVEDAQLTLVKVPTDGTMLIRLTPPNVT